jgi:hypothetical protein
MPSARSERLLAAGTDAHHRPTMPPIVRPRSARTSEAVLQPVDQWWATAAWPVGVRAAAVVVLEVIRAGGTAAELLEVDRAVVRGRASCT